MIKRKSADSHVTPYSENYLNQYNVLALKLTHDLLILQCGVQSSVLV